MFGLFKNKYPVLKEDMITPAGEPIATTDAKKIFKKYMKDIGYLDKDELSEHASYLSDEIKEHEQYLKEECSDKKEEVVEAKNNLKQLKAKLKSSEGEAMDDIQDEIEGVEEELEDATSELNEAIIELEKFKKDKRSFLVEYINNQTQNR